MEPENHGFQKDFPFPGGSMLNFGGVVFLFFQLLLHLFNLHFKSDVENMHFQRTGKDPCGWVLRWFSINRCEMGNIGVNADTN